MIDKFLVRRRSDMQNVTLEELLGDKEIGPMVATSVGFVRRSATLADVRVEMKPSAIVPTSSSLKTGRATNLSLDGSRMWICAAGFLGAPPSRSPR